MPKLDEASQTFILSLIDTAAAAHKPLALTIMTADNQRDLIS